MCSFPIHPALMRPIPSVVTACGSRSSTMVSPLLDRFPDSFSPAGYGPCSPDWRSTARCSVPVRPGRGATWRRPPAAWSRSRWPGTSIPRPGRAAAAAPSFTSSPQALPWSRAAVRTFSRAATKLGAVRSTGDAEVVAQVPGPDEQHVGPGQRRRWRRRRRRLRPTRSGPRPGAPRRRGSRAPGSRPNRHARL